VLRAKVTVKAKSLKRRHFQTATVKTVAGASVQLEINYASGLFSSRKGIAKGGVYRYRWKVPKVRGRVNLVASVSTADGGEGKARASFRIR